MAKQSGSPTRLAPRCAVAWTRCIRATRPSSRSGCPPTSKKCRWPASEATMGDKFVDLTTGLVSRRIYSDEAIYQREIEGIFARCWLYLGHESQIQKPGDYLTTYMGEDPVILWRDARGQPRVFLNTCRHRGNRLCMYERGNASSLTCSYHGWSYNSEGELTGVPFHTEAYYDELDRSQWGLIETPRLTSYGGLVFACWDGGAPSLDAYPGRFRVY